MKLGTTLRALPLVLVMLAIAEPGAAGDNEYSRATLKGLAGVRVVVEDFHDNARRAGFDKQKFQTAAELKLRLAGIKVLTRDESLATPGMPWLHASVASMATEADRSAPFGMSLELVQGVLLERNREPSNAATWSVYSIGNGDAPYVLEGFKEQMDIFLNAWLSVNPKGAAK